MGTLHLRGLNASAAMKATFEVKSIALPGRTTLQYVEQGDRGGLPVVLLHGVTDSWRSFELLLPHLPASLHAFALTQRGHGDAGRPASGYRIEDLAGDVAAFLDAQGLEAAVLVGHSMGSLVAQRCAIDRPERVRGLALIGAFATLRGNTPVQELWETTLATLADPVDRGFVLDFQRSTVAREIPGEFLDAVVAESLKVPARVWREAFAGMLADDQTPALGRIAAPTLIVWGEHDAFADGAQQALLSQRIPGAALRVFAGAGHAPHWEEPARVAAHLAAFAAALREPA